MGKAYFGDKVLIDLEPVALEEIGPDAATRWFTHGVEWLHEGGVLFIRDGHNLVPVCKIVTLAGAIYFSLGFWNGFAGNEQRISQLRKGK